MRQASIDVVIETPAGSRNKYLYDAKHRVFRLHKMLPLGARFPFDFGFIPGTRAEDGDPLDVLVLCEEPTFPGCVVPIRLLGVIEAEQMEKGTKGAKAKTIRNDRLIGTPETAKIRPRQRTLADLPGQVLDQVEHFFVSYNRAEGRVFRCLARRGPEAALRLVQRGRSK